MHKKTIAVIFGGQSSEHEVSRNSAFHIISAMDTDKFFVLPIGITKKGQWLIYSGPVEHIKTGEWEKYGTPAIFSPDATQKAILKIVGGSVKQIPIDAVFPVLHGAWGEDGTIQGLCELAQVPYVGAGVLSSALCMDKVYTKAIAKSFRIPQTKYLWLFAKELEHKEAVLKRVEKKIGYPCFVKPSCAGSSVGISKATNRNELETALFFAAGYDRKIIVEEAVIGREMECSVLGNDLIHVSGVGEILSAGDFYDYDAKYNNPLSATVIPADLPEETVMQMQKIAKRIYRAVDCCGLARVDFFLREKDGKVLFNEMNTMPGFTDISMYPKLWEAAGMPLSVLTEEMIRLALERDNGIRG